MTRLITGGLAALLLLVSLHSANAAVVITKSPNLGPFWSPLSNAGGTYIYANSFIAPTNGAVSELGTWLLSNDNAGDLPQLRFELYGSIGSNPANGPDSANVLWTTAAFTPAATASLTLFTATTTGVGTNLVAGQTYWFGASVVGTPSEIGSYQVGGHTQNSVYADNGTFWYSNDPSGISFDGQGFTPEMAFTLTIADASTVPEPASVTLWTLGALGCAISGYRRRKTARI